MRIAIPYDNGQVFQHFGHTRRFKIYDVEGKTVQATSVVNTNGTGHGALADLLKKGEIAILICGGIGPGAQKGLSQAGIRWYGGVTGDADQAVEDFLYDKLNYNPAATCNHHGEGREKGHHHCSAGEQGQGHQCGENCQG